MTEFSFDQLADRYDETFTDTAVGVMQRKVVWNSLEMLLGSKKNPLNILELNCGTGEDAIFLSKKGHKVTATDLSKKMLSKAKEKASRENADSIEFMQLDLKCLDNLKRTNQFDLIFSNFGGFNCLNIDEINHLSKAVRKYLSTTGMLIFVLMPDRCLIEKIYAIFKRDRSLFFRRDQSVQEIKMGIGKTLTWYHSPKSIATIFTKENYKAIYLRSVGFIPSYFSIHAEKSPGLFRIVRLINYLAMRTSLLVRYSDHFLVAFTPNESRR
ncbi:MAG: methyltransferase domain-containing protein [Saprospiraceae bacterium]|nr:methyltransferase domain-containing protein [Saprospiraceae bacterium]